jgi:integrase
VDDYGDRFVFAVSRYDLRKHLRELARTRADSTMRRYKRAHWAFWRFCQMQGWIIEDVSRPKERPQPYQFVDELPDEAPRLLREAMAVYLDELEVRGSSEYHIKTVRSRLKPFAIVHGDRALEEIGARDLQEHFRSLSKTRAEATMAGYRATHKAFWSYCREEGWVADRPARHLKRYSYDPAKPKAVPEDYLQVVIDNLQDFVDHRDQHPRDVRDALFVSLSIDSGARRGEMGNLQRSKVEKELEEATLFRGDDSRLGPAHIIYSVASKGKTGAAVVRFTEETARLFRLWFRLVDEDLPAGRGEDRVFLSVVTGEPLAPNSLSNHCFRRVCEFAGVPHFRSHAVRHRNVTEIIDATGDPKIAQRVAGHRSLEVTLRIYNETLESHALQATATLARRRGRSNGKTEKFSDSDGDPMERLAQLQAEMDQVLAQIRGSNNGSHRVEH